MILPRLVPVLLLRGAGLVKTVRFKDPIYVGDPRNAVKIFNEREVDELVLLDIQATPQKRPPQFDLVAEIASEAFMPVAYGGGVWSVEDARRLVASGVEKIILGAAAVEQKGLVGELAAQIGSSSVVVCIDYQKSLWGRPAVRTRSGARNSGLDPLDFAVEMQHQGAGELLLQSIDRDGTMQGYDLEMIRGVAGRVSVPVIACGGAGKLEDFRQAVEAGASAAAAGSLFVFHGRRRAVLISYPARSEIRSLWSRGVS